MSDTAHAYFMAKLCLVVFNAGRIIQRLVVYFLFVYDNQGSKPKEPGDGSVKVDEISVTRIESNSVITIITLALVLFIMIHLLGIIGAIRENRRCLYIYAIILIFINLLSLFAPGFNPAIFIVYVIMIVLAIGYALMLKQREDHLRLHAPRIIQA